VTDTLVDFHTGHDGGRVRVVGEVVDGVAIRGECEREPEPEAYQRVRDDADVLQHDLRAHVADKARKHEERLEERRVVLRDFPLVSWVEVVEVEGDLLTVDRRLVVENLRFVKEGVVDAGDKVDGFERRREEECDGTRAGVGRADHGAEERDENEHPCPPAPQELMARAYFTKDRSCSRPRSPRAPGCLGFDRAEGGDRHDRQQQRSEELGCF